MEKTLESISFESTTKRPKCIIDTDALLGGDDVMVFSALKRLGWDILGVTTAAGNLPVEMTTAATLRQMELLEIDCPVAMGENETLMGLYDDWFISRGLCVPEFKVMAREFPKGVTYDSDYIIKIYKDFNGMTFEKFGKPKKKIVEEKPEELIYRLISENPNEVVIFSIAPPLNIAKFVKNHPEMVDKVKSIIYMGGTFNCPGTITPFAEPNWYNDPWSVQECLRSGIKEQIVIPLDACEVLKLRPGDYERSFPDLNDNSLKSLLILDSDNSYCWDLLTAYAMDRVVNGKFEDLNLYTKHIDICLNENVTYGQVMFCNEDYYPGEWGYATPPEYFTNVKVLLEPNIDDFNLFLDKLAKLK